MAHAYTPGLTVAPQTRHRCRRELPVAGEVRVEVGQRVDAEQTVAEAFMPGDITPINLAKVLAMPPGDVVACMVRQKGDHVEEGDVLARTKGIFGLFKTEYRSTVDGTVESVSGVTGQVIVRGKPQPLTLLAYLGGEVIEVMPTEGVVIEADVAFVQGIFGIGGETYGPIRIVGSREDKLLSAEMIEPDMKGAILVAAARVTDSALKKAVKVGAAAVVAAGIDDADLKDFLGYDLGVAITGSEDVGLTLIITEGFGDITMAQRTWELLKSHEGDQAAVNGTTQIRAGVMRPEIVIPLAKDHDEKQGETSHEAGYLELGTTVRIIRDPYFGQIGTVSDLPSEPQALASGSKSRVLEVRFDSGDTAIVPRANVELIE